MAGQYLLATTTAYTRGNGRTRTFWRLCQAPTSSQGSSGQRGSLKAARIPSQQYVACSNPTRYGQREPRRGGGIPEGLLGAPCPSHRLGSTRGRGERACVTCQGYSELQPATFRGDRAAKGAGACRYRVFFPFQRGRIAETLQISPRFQKNPFLLFPPRPTGSVPEERPHDCNCQLFHGHCSAVSVPGASPGGVHAGVFPTAERAPALQVPRSAGRAQVLYPFWPACHAVRMLRPVLLLLGAHDLCFTHC
mmetsp:Transcript_5089/g.12405  ORF Transcript_5089/g.12405 Transcript_5089/m.12405 type:complete len:250 (-) Transcript_5089:140-889(-)